MADLEFAVNADWEKFLKENSWAAFVPASAKDEKGQEYVRNALRKDSQIYRIISEDNNGRQSYQCNKCGSDIMSATVAHPIHDGPFPLSGSGECHYEQVPYCPKCEKEPSFLVLP